MMMTEPEPSAGVYSISVAAELTGLTVRSLRLYERHELLRPVRTSGGTRRFSGDDLGRLRRISELVAEGVNLTGIAKILDLEEGVTELRGDNTALRADIAALETDNTRLRTERGRQPARKGATGDREPPRRRSASRRSPADGHRDPPSRPG